MSLEIDQTAMMDELEKSDSTEESSSIDTAPESPSIIDLDSAEKFKLDGKEWTLEDFKKDREQSQLRQQDYTRKMQEIARNRETYESFEKNDKRFYDNLQYDLKTIRENPHLAAKFLEIYPQKFHSYLEHVLGMPMKTPTQTGSPSNQTSSYAQIDPQVMQEFNQIKSYVFETQVKANESQLEAYDQKFSGKYKMADPETVYTKAEILYNSQKKDNPEFKMDESTWEKIWKSDHEKNQKRYEAVYKEQQTNQKKVHQRGRDVASGGGVPGQSPVKHRTIREATQAALDELDS